jgi:hypothetical protein
MKNWSERLHAHVDGKPDPGPHPLVAALLRAKEGEPSLLQMFVVNDTMFRYGESALHTAQKPDHRIQPHDG